MILKTGTVIIFIVPCQTLLLRKHIGRLNNEQTTQKVEAFLPQEEGTPDEATRRRTR